MIGSFLNVVIVRLPNMLFHIWDNKPLPSTPYNLCVPRSMCHHCNSTIAFYDNIPILSFMILRGRCRICQSSIPKFYPAIEFLTMVCSIVVTLKLGFTIKTGAALILTWCLIALSIIDLKHTILPDEITLPLIWLGLILSLFGIFQNSESAIIGAVSGYLTFWLIYWVFKLITKKEGMGYGDFKLLSLLGAWFGWQALPIIILLSSSIGAIIGIILILLGKHDKNMPIPFGPFLSLSGWVVMLLGKEFYFL